jgi:hypothetical protein
MRYLKIINILIYNCLKAVSLSILFCISKVIFGPLCTLDRRVRESQRQPGRCGEANNLLALPSL